MADTFTPEQIAQILEEFFKTVGTRQYIGARYVPLFGRKDEESIVWDNSAPYEPLTIVLYQGNSYTSRQYVPEGVEITNEEFWAVTGNYNAQIEEYRRVAQGALTAAQDAQNDIDTLLPKDDFSAENTVKDYVDGAVQSVQSDIDTLLPKSAFSENATVKDYIDLRAIVFDTVADMQQATNLEVGFTCKTNGFHTVGDGGDAFYIITENVTPNGMDILRIDDALSAVLVFDSHEIIVDKFGCKCDGTDDSAYIQRAVDCIEGAGSVIFNPKTYSVATTINVNKDDIVFAAPNGKATIDLISDTTVLQINGLRFNMQNIKLYRANLNVVSTCIGVDYSNVPTADADSQFKDCEFQGFYICVNCYGRNISFKNCTFSTSLNGININFFENEGTKEAIHGMVVDTCRFHAIGLLYFQAAIYDNGFCVKVPSIESSNPFNGIQVVNNYFDFCANIYSGNIAGLSFVSNCCLSYYGRAFYCDIPSQAYPNSFQALISNNVFTPSNQYQPRMEGRVCYLVNVVRFVFINNQVCGSPYNCIHMVSCTDISIKNNYMQKANNNEFPFVTLINNVATGIIMSGNTFQCANAETNVITATSPTNCACYTNGNYLIGFTSLYQGNIGGVRPDALNPHFL